jgi:hypothetical protein
MLFLGEYGVTLWAVQEREGVCNLQREEREEGVCNLQREERGSRKWEGEW